VREAIITDLKASTKEGVFREILQRLIDVGRLPASELENLTRLLLEREELGSTGIGMGFAEPYTCYYSKIERGVVAVARSPKGVEFDAFDGEPVHLFLLVICCPRHSNSLMYLTGDILRVEHLRDELMNARTHEQFIEWLERADREVSRSTEVGR
jgi:mannitol/fructose-specific phosphotransferase system IIA component (Ntr-type)